MPSRKMTEPIGVPARELTVAVSDTVCPKTAVAVDVPSVVVVAAAVTGAEVFNSTPTVLEKVLAATRSTRPSPFRSPAATPKGLLPPVGTACDGLEGAVTVADEHGQPTRDGLRGPHGGVRRPSLLKSPRASPISPN